jgi:hypothetical protein
MHHLGANYSQFYGGFMEAMQVASGFKQITGDPVKKGYQVHHIFAKTLYDGGIRGGSSDASPNDVCLVRID